MQRFEPVDPKVSFPELERRILEFWRDTDVFARSIELRKDDPLWVFSEGPPTANGTPGIHHVEARVVQGRLPALQDDDGPLRAAQRRLGLPRPPGGARGREGDRHDRQARHRGVRDRRVQPAVPRVGGPLRRRVRTTDRAHRLLDRHVRRVLDDEHRVHRVGVVVAQAAAPARPARRVRQGHGVLPALRDRPLGRRGGDGLSDGRGPERLREVQGRCERERGAQRSARRFASRLDDHAVDASVQRRSRRRQPRARTWW